MSVRAALAAAMALAALFKSASAMAAIDDLQIDWVIPVGSIDEKGLNGGEKRRVTVRPVPRKMFESSSDVVTIGGVKLLPAREPLYAMVGPVFMVCSQTIAPAAYVAKSDRVCLRDTDRDGKLDSFFTRSRGRSFMAGDQMWFAMNNNIPNPTGAIKPIELVEVDRMRAPERPVLDFSFSTQKDGTVRLGVVIEGEHSFSTSCLEISGSSAVGNQSTFACLDPGFVVFRRPGAPSSKPAYELQIVTPKRELAVRFDVVPRLMGARLMRGMYFE